MSVTEEQQPLDTSGFTCAWCGRETPNQTSPTHPGAEPEIGDPTVCISCNKISIFERDGLRRPTDAEQGSFDAVPEIGQIQGLLEVLGDKHVLALSVTRDHESGEYHIEDESLPEEFRRQVEATLKERDLEERASELKEYVTAEVAHHVLAVNGDEQASWPSAAVSTLIQFIKVCRESDSRMLHHINHCEAFHGYVLAVDIAEHEKRGARPILRMIAGLDDPVVVDGC